MTPSELTRDELEALVTKLQISIGIAYRQLHRAFNAESEPDKARGHIRAARIELHCALNELGYAGKE